LTAPAQASNRLPAALGRLGRSLLGRMRRPVTRIEHAGRWGEAREFADGVLQGESPPT
jgi:hypothetical protein